MMSPQPNSRIYRRIHGRLMRTYLQNMVAPLPCGLPAHLIQHPHTPALPNNTHWRTPCFAD